MNFSVLRSSSEQSSMLKTVVFVDYESLYWGMRNQFGEKPDLDSFVQDLKKRGKIESIRVFGDFTRPDIEKEVARIRTITNDITDCQSFSQNPKKDYTDFIMLDHIYQSLSREIHYDQYVLVTGDGHFHSVTTFMKTYKDKSVGIYGVKGCINTQLVNCSSWCVEVTPLADDRSDYKEKILEAIFWAERRGIIPSFAKTCENASKHYGGSEDKFRAALSALIEEGFITQSEKQMSTGFAVRALEPKWELLKEKKLVSW